MTLPDHRTAYVRDADEIYRRSFAIIRDEADLSAFGAAERHVATRVIHACGMVDIAADLAFTPGAVAAGAAALAAGCPVFCDVTMVARGIIPRLMPAQNDIICTLGDAGVANRAAGLGTTRSAAAVERWLDRLDGAVVAIGNAPTALFHLLETIGEGGPRPAAIIGMPVGFVGAVESKQALGLCTDLPSIVVHGRRGGSAMAAAAVNALGQIASGDPAMT